MSVDYVFKCEYTLQQAAAVKSLFNNKEQAIAVDWILSHACGLNNVSFCPNSSESTAFLEGRRFVGQRIMRLVDGSPEFIALNAKETV